MVFYRKHKLTLRFVILFYMGPVSASDITERQLVFLNEEASYYCYSELENLVLSSNYPLAEKNRKKADRISLDTSYNNVNILTVEIIDHCANDLPSDQYKRPVETLSYLPKSNTLWVENSNGLKKQINFNKKLGLQYQECIQKEQFCSARRKQIGEEPLNNKSEKWIVVGDNRAYFHSAPTPECKSKVNFVVPTDKVKTFNRKAISIVNSEKNEYVMASYGKVRGWLNTESLISPENVHFELENKTKGNYQVKDKRLYFYQTPELACEKGKQPYVIEGDIVWVSGSHTDSGFVNAKFIHPVTGNMTFGWLRLNGLSKL